MVSALVQSDGSDYILTDIKITSTMCGMRYKAAPLFNAQSTHGAIAGTRKTNATTTSEQTFMAYFLSTGKRQVYWNGAKGTDFGSYSNGNIYEDEYFASPNSVVSSYPMMVFAANSAGSADYIKPFKLYYLQILGVDGSPVVDLRPYRTINGEIGLKDTISGKFYSSVNNSLIGG